VHPIGLRRCRDAIAFDDRFLPLRRHHRDSVHRFYQEQAQIDGGRPTDCRERFSRGYLRRGGSRTDNWSPVIRFWTIRFRAATWRKNSVRGCAGLPSNTAPAGTFEMTPACAPIRAPLSDPQVPRHCGLAADLNEILKDRGARYSHLGDNDAAASQSNIVPDLD
jgi:hypothetical protein